MYARNRQDGTPIKGTLEIITGRAELLEDGFERNSDGNLEGEHEGSTEVFWNDQRTIHRQNEAVFLDETGNELTQSEIELVEERDTALTPPSEPATPPTLDTVGRETSFTDTVTLYEIIHPDGSGHELHTDMKAARRQRRTCDRIAMAHYIRASTAKYVEEDGATG